MRNPHLRGAGSPLQLQMQPKGVVELEHQGRGHRGHDRAEVFDADRAHLLGLSLGIGPGGR